MSAPTPSTASPRLITANRDQLIMEMLNVEKFIPADHPARAIWEFVGGLDLEPYRRKIKFLEGTPGRPAFDPRILISVWIYVISDGEGSAREIEKLCTHDPAYRWMTGLEVINHHTLSDFRIDHGKELDELFTQVLGVLSAADLVAMKRVTQAVTDNSELASAMETTEARTGKRPETVVADGGYTNHANIVAMADAEIDFIGSFRDTSAMVDAQYERRGIAPEFRNEAFRYDGEAFKKRPLPGLERCASSNFLQLPSLSLALNN